MDGQVAENSKLCGVRTADQVAPSRQTAWVGGGGDITHMILTINVPLFKKLRDIIFFWWDNHFMSHLEGLFVGANTFLIP